MTTAETIEAMTDAGLFEVLATKVLRHIDSDYERVEHIGVNAAGKTIKGSVDGFTLVPGTSPPRYVMAAFSTDKAESVEKKLLFDHRRSKGKKYKDADDGDLIKAARVASRIKRSDPSATFVLTFCTNKRLGDELIAKAIATANGIGMELRFLAQSQLRDFLDDSPDGQWLRKKYLGIDAERLSRPLLAELSKVSLGLCTRSLHVL